MLQGQGWWGTPTKWQAALMPLWRRGQWGWHACLMSQILVMADSLTSDYMLGTALDGRGTTVGPGHPTENPPYANNARETKECSKMPRAVPSARAEQKCPVLRKWPRRTPTSIAGDVYMAWEGLGHDTTSKVWDWYSTEIIKYKQCFPCGYSFLKNKAIQNMEL